MQMKISGEPSRPAGSVYTLTTLAKLLFSSRQYLNMIMETKKANMITK